MNSRFLALLVLLPVVADARPLLIPLQIGHDQWSPEKFGYTITQRGDTQQTSFVVALSPDAAKATERARIVVKKDGTVILDADLAFKGTPDGGKELTAIVDRGYLTDGEIIVFSRPYNAPLVSDFAGFRIGLDRKWTAEPSAAPLPPAPRPGPSEGAR